MNFAGFLLLFIAHFFSGRGVLSLFKLDLKPLPSFCFSLMLGVPLLSFAPCVVQLLHIPITTQSILTSVIIAAVLFSSPIFFRLRKPQFMKFKLPELSEVPFLIVILFLAVMSVWRCFYFPVFSRDMTSGPELLAKYAILEKNMISSVFTLDLSSTNNYFKSPYITCLQIIYKLLVCPFGQLWLTLLFIPFTLWIYDIVRSSLHPLLAGLVMMMFVAMPELYAYTYLILYDYSNMVFFVTGFYFFVRYLESKQLNQFLFSSLLFGIATYIRTETLIIMVFIAPLMIYHFYKNKFTPVKAASYFGIFYFVSFAFYFICIKVFVHAFVPVPLDISGQLNKHIFDISGFFQRISDINNDLIFSDTGIGVYGYFIYFFLFIVFVDLIFKRKFSWEARMALYGVLVVYLGLALVGFLLPLADVRNTTKRGMFKVLPIILMYLANSSFLLSVSALFRRIENPGEKTTKPAPRPAYSAPKVSNAPKPQPKKQNKK